MRALGPTDDGVCSKQPLGGQRVGELQRASELERLDSNWPTLRGSTTLNANAAGTRFFQSAKLRSARKVGRVGTHFEHVETRRVAGDIAFEIVFTDE